MAILKDLIVNGGSRFIGKLTASKAEITDETVTTINGVTVGSNPKFTDTTSLTSMTGTLPVANGGTGKTTANDAANNLLTGLPEWTADPSDNVYLIRQDTGGSNLFGRVKFSTVWNYISGKISSVLGLTASTYGGSAAKVNNHTVATDVPANAVFTDTNNAVTQTATSTSSDYEVLFSATADNTTRTEGARKNSNLKFNPSTGNLQATQLNGVAIGSSPKFTDTTYESKAAASGGTAVSLVTTGEKYTWNNKSSLALGTTSSTAYRGDYGNAAYAHGVTNKGSAFSSGLYKITTNSEGHVTAATAVAKADITALGIPAQDTTYTAASADPIGPKSVAEVGTSVKYAREDHVHPTKMVPLQTKTYTDVIATANDNNGAGFFYMKVRPTAFNSYWHTKTRVVATVPGYANYYTDTTFDVYGYDNSVTSYECRNRIKTTSYRPIYYNSVFLTNSTGYTNSCGHWIGVNLTSSTNNTSSTYKRTLEVEVLTCDNCTIELQDSLITPTNIPDRSAHTGWYTSTNTSYSNYDAYSYGLKHTGDNNTTTISNLLRNGGAFAADSVVYRYQLLFQIDENTLTPLNNNSNTTGTSKTMLTDVEFDPFGDIYYYSTTTTVEAEANISAGALFYAYYGIDLRYTFNCAKTLTSHRPVYLVVTPLSNGKCKIASTTPWSQTLPTTNDGNWYILVGRTYSTYQFTLYYEHPIYYHDGTSVKQILKNDITGNAATVNGHTVLKDVPANAVFTDTTYSLVTPSTPGLMSAADKNKLDSIITSNANSPIIMIETSAFSSLPVTVTSDRITANHYLLESTLSNPSAQEGDWTVTTNNGSLTISGTISGTTSAVLLLGRVDAESATMLVFDISSFSSLPVTVTDSRITAYHYVLHTEVGNPQAQISDWTVTTGSGTMSITGSISGSSTLRVILGTAGSL